TIASQCSRRKRTWCSASISRLSGKPQFCARRDCRKAEEHTPRWPAGVHSFRVEEVRSADEGFDCTGAFAGYPVSAVTSLRDLPPPRHALPPATVHPGFREGGPSTVLRHVACPERAPASRRVSSGGSG